MKIPTLFGRKKLRATTTRRSPLGVPDPADYEEMSEPNMKLSRALLIVLVLHVVAVAGIIAFNAIKTRQASLPPPLSKATNTANQSEPTTAETLAASPSVALPPRDDAKTARVAPKAIVKEDRKIDHPGKPAEKVIPPVDATKMYVVAKGDNPVTIAKKLKVSYDDLIAVNHIDDPRKLQIGQKLVIPPRVAKAKKVDE